MHSLNRGTSSLSLIAYFTCYAGTSVLCENLSETVLKAQLEIFLRQIKYIQVDIYDNS